MRRGSSGAWCGWSTPSTGPTPFSATFRNGPYRRRWCRKASPCSAPCSIPRPANSSTPFAERGAFLNDKPIEVTGRETLEGALFIASGGLFKKRIWKEPWPGVESRWVNSVAYRLALVAAGRADATVSLSAKSEWDLAAGVLIVEEAGGVVTDHHGHAFRFNLPIPRFPSLVAAPPGLHAKLIERTSRVDL